MNTLRRGALSKCHVLRGSTLRVTFLWLEMSLAASDWDSRLRAIAAQSESKRNAFFKDCDIAKLTCSYISVAERISPRSKVRFEWFAEVGGNSNKGTVEARCDNVVKDGVPLPAHWKTLLRCLRLHAAMEKSVKRFRELNVGFPTLRVLGVPKLSPPPSSGTALVVGSVVQLRTRRGARQDYLLAAHIDGVRRVHVVLL